MSSGAVAAKPPISPTRAASFTASVVLPESAKRFADVTSDMLEFRERVAAQLAAPTGSGWSAVTSGVVAVMPWLAGLGALIMGNAVAVASCVTWASAQHALRRCTTVEPLDAKATRAFQDFYAKETNGAEPLRASAMRHTAINALNRVQRDRGLGIEAELLLQDLKYAETDSHLDSQGRRAARAADVLTGDYYLVQAGFDDIEPFDMLAVDERFRKPGYHHDHFSQTLATASSRAQSAVDAAVSADLRKLLNRGAE